MKLVIASDIHGSAVFAEQLMQRIDDESPDRILLLGDLLYHGPRNDLPLGYAPKQVIEMLNGIANRITAVRGNCDAEVDQMVLNFPCMCDYAQVIDGCTTLFLTHGHLFDLEAPCGAQGGVPMLRKGSVVLSGHTHVKALERRDGILFANPGSTSIPKDGSRSYAVWDNGAVALKLLEDGRIIGEEYSADEALV